MASGTSGKFPKCPNFPKWRCPHGFYKFELFAGSEKTMFPVEIWEEILQYVDARNLMRLRTVCITWNAVIENILERTHAWRAQCMKDVPQDLWCPLMENRINAETQCQEYQTWLEMYKLWWGWKNVVSMVPRIETLGFLPDVKPLEDITCIATLDNIIAIGTTQGCVEFYDIISDKLLCRAYHVEFLRSVHMFKKGNHITAVSTSIRYGTKFWNLTTRREEKDLRCVTSFVTTSFEKCYVISGNRLTCYQLSEDKNGRIDKLSSDELPGWVVLKQIVAVAADKDRLMLWMKHNGPVGIRRIDEGYDYTAEVYHTIPEFEIAVRYYRTFKPRVAACIGVNGEFGFCIDGGKWKIYDVLKKFFVRVTAVMFHFTIVAIGLESGEVHIFAVKDVESLMHLDVDAMRSRKLVLDTEPIFSINAMEHDSKSYLVAATNRRVHLIKFT